MAYELATSTWGDEEVAALEEVIRSGRFTMGEKVRQFESAFAAHFGARHAVMASSGSAANLLMLAGLFYHPDLDLEAGDEVIVPAVSWSTTYFPVHQLGLKLVFVDIDEDSLNIDVDQVEAAITDRTRAILAVNLLGNPADLLELERIAAQHGIVLLEDNCESMGARLDGRYTGTFGLAGTYSTFFSHHLCTMEGGMVLTDDERLYHTLLSLRAHGWMRDLPEGSHLDIEADDFVRQFRFVLPGYNLRPLEMEAAVGLVQLPKLGAFVEQRRANAGVFIEMFSEQSSIRLQRENGESSWFGFSMVLTGEAAGRRTELVDLLKKNEVECRPIVSGNFLNNPAIEHLDHRAELEYTNADAVDESGIMFGNHHYDIHDSLELLRKVLEDAGII